MATVVINHVEKVFKKEAAEIVALEDTTLTIESGSFLCLMGPSGSGKSTLLNLIAGIDRPSSGQVLVDQEDITRLSETELALWRNHTIGFIFQTFNLIPVLTAFENVELPLLLTRLSKTERREHVETALTLVGLNDRMTHYPRQLSGGRNNAWPSLVPSLPTRLCCWRMNLPGTWMRTLRKRFWLYWKN